MNVGSWHGYHMLQMTRGIPLHWRLEQPCHQGRGGMVAKFTDCVGEEHWTVEAVRENVDHGRAQTRLLSAQLYCQPSPFVAQYLRGDKMANRHSWQDGIDKSMHQQPEHISPLDMNLPGIDPLVCRPQGVWLQNSL